MYKKEELVSLINKCESIERVACEILDSVQYRKSLYEHLLKLNELLEKLDEV